jgi:hypothetical protein
MNEGGDARGGSIETRNSPVVRRGLHGALEVGLGEVLLLARLPDDAAVETEQVGVAGARQQRARVAALGAGQVALHLVQVLAVVAQEQRVLGVQQQHAAVVLAHVAAAALPAASPVAALPAALSAADAVPAGAGAVEEAVEARGGPVILFLVGLEDGRDRGVAEEDGGSGEGGEVGVGPGAAERVEGARRRRGGGGERAELRGRREPGCAGAGQARGGEGGGAGQARGGGGRGGFHRLSGAQAGGDWLVGSLPVASPSSAAVFYNSRGWRKAWRVTARLTASVTGAAHVGRRDQASRGRSGGACEAGDTCAGPPRTGKSRDSRDRGEEDDDVSCFLPSHQRLGAAAVRWCPASCQASRASWCSLQMVLGWAAAGFPPRAVGQAG